MKRAVSYARFSTELQNDKSIVDQNRSASDYCKKKGYELVRQYSDAAKSGASILGRDGLLELLADAKNGQFDVVVVEELDRLSRDMSDMTGIYKMLTFKDITIESIHEGTASTVTVGVRAIVSQLYREDNAHKVRRGLEGKIRAGLSAGGQAYGYRPNLAEKGKLIIEEGEAEVIRHIFQEYAEGVSPAALCTQLVADQVPAPRGKLWSPSALVGWKVRGTGLLRNTLYDGRITWNKVTMVKDPTTGKRVSKPNPQADWQEVAVEEYRIVDHKLFEAVQKRLEEASRRSKDYTEQKRLTMKEIGEVKRPRYLFSGLLKCGYCGGALSAKGVDRNGRVRVRCANHKNNKTCPHPVSYYLDTIEDLVLKTVHKQLENPEAAIAYVKRYNSKRIELASTIETQRSKLEHQIEQCSADIQAGAEKYLLADDGPTQTALSTLIKERSAKRDQLVDELEQLPNVNEPVGLNFATIAVYSGALLEIKRLMEEVPEQTYKYTGIMKELIDSIEVYEGREGHKIEVIINGKIQTFLEAPIAQDLSGLALVAEEGLEPPTRGL